MLATWVRPSSPCWSCLPLYRWRRLERWLTFCTAGILVVCLAPPYLLAVWSFIPGMNRIQHEFYFYTHHLQLYLVLLAGVHHGILAPRRTGRRHSEPDARGTLALLFVVVLMLLAFGALAESFEANDPGLQGNLLFALLLLSQRFPPAPVDDIWGPKPGPLAHHHARDNDGRPV